MSNITLFIQVHGKPDLKELELPETVTRAELHESLEKLGVKVDAETFVFLDEAEAHDHGDKHERLSDLKHGCRVHVSRCKQIETTVHYLDQTATHRFAPGTRVRAVKAWAARHFGVNPKDAAEHVLQLCKSTERPSSDTPLNQLVHGHGCAVCFDFVPEKRVVG
jgi:hypothetical protein